MKKEIKFSVEFVSTFDMDSAPASVKHALTNMSEEELEKWCKESAESMFRENLLPTANEGGTYCTLSV